MGVGAILLWSTGAACIVFTGRRIGIWQSMGLAALACGLTQIAVHVALGRRLRAILAPPPKFWLAIVLGYLLYLMLYAAGLATARTEVEVVGVGLMNYLWPVLAILFTTWMVPGERMRGRLIAAMALSLVGVLLVNLDAADHDVDLPDELGGGRFHIAAGQGLRIELKDK